MNWIAVSTSLFDDPAVHGLADDLDVEVAQAAGHFVAVLCHLPVHAADGDLAAVRDATIEAWAGWRGPRGLFATTFRRYFTDPAGVVKAWEKWNGANLRAAERSRDRSKAWRDAKRAAKDAADDARMFDALSNTPMEGRPDQWGGTEGRTEYEPRSTPLANGVRTGFATRSERVPNGSTGQDMTGQDRTEKREEQIAAAVASAPGRVVAPLRGSHEPAISDPAPMLPLALPPAPAPAPTRAPKPTNGKGEPLARLRAAWAARVGTADPARFAKLLSPALDTHPETALAAAIVAFEEIRDALPEREKQFRTLQNFSENLAEYVRLGAMPLTDANGVPTERGRRGVLNFSAISRN